MPNFNKVFLMGNITRDIELKQIPSGQTVASFGLATNRRFKTKEGEEREEVTFVDCEAWGRAAEVIAQYMSKGKPLFVEGRLKLDTWDDKEGKKHSKLKLVVEEFQFIGGRDSGGAAGGSGGGSSGRSRGEGDYAPAPPARSGRGTGGAAPHQPVEEDDIPF